MTLLDPIQEHLAAAGIARRVTDPGPGPLPPFWRSPKPGAPAPGEKGRDRDGNVTNPGEADVGLVLSGFVTGRIPPGPGEGYSRRRTVDIQIRSTYYPPLEEIGERLEDEFAPGPYGIRFDWVMGGLYVLETRLFNGLAPIAASEGQGYHYRLTLLVETLT